MNNQVKKHLTSYNTVISKRFERLKKGYKPILGIDIGSSSIKIVQMKGNNKISKWGIEILPEGMVSQGRVVTIDQLAERLKRTMKKNNIIGKQCSLCLSGNELIVRELKLPEMNESQIIENIKYEITSFLPLKHEEYCIDYKILEYIPSKTGTPGKMRIMVAAAPNDLIQSYINTLKKVNLKVTYVDVAPNIAGKLAKWTTLNQDTQERPGNIGIIDFGAQATNINILKDGDYFIHKTIPNGGDYLTSKIAEKLNMDLMEAEEYKKKTNFIESNFCDNEYLFVKNFLDYIITDIDRTITFFKNRNNQKGVDRIYIMGAGSLLRGLPEYINEHFNVEVSYLSDALRLFPKNNDSEDKVAAFSQAIGATLREE